MDTKPDGALVTSQLGQWISELTISSIPGDILSHLKLCLLDSIGCGLFGAIQPCGRIAGDVAATFSPDGIASLFARVEKASPADAALANRTAIHGFEIDDAHITSSLHPGAVTLPASLAVAEARQGPGADLLTALATGYEVGLRVGICAGVSHSTSGYHVTGTAGALGATAAAARLLKLPPLHAAMHSGSARLRPRAFTRHAPTAWPSASMRVAPHRGAWSPAISPSAGLPGASMPSKRRSAGS